MNYLKTSKIIGILVSISFICLAFLILFSLALELAFAGAYPPAPILAFFALILFIMFFNLINFLRLKKKNLKKIRRFLQYPLFLFILLFLFNFLYLREFFEETNFVISSILLFSTLPVVVFYYLISLLLRKVEKEREKRHAQKDSKSKEQENKEERSQKGKNLDKPRYCNRCGQELDKNSNYCTNCGNKIKILKRDN